MASRLLRIATIIFAYLVASIVAGSIAFLGMVILSVGPGVLTPQGLVELLPPSAVASGVAAVTALLPTLPVGIYAERHGERRADWYAKAGFAIGLGALLVYAVASEAASRSVSNATFDDVKFFLLLAACVMVAGVCSGFTYWGIAGRRAGRSASTAARAGR